MSRVRWPRTFAQAVALSADEVAAIVETLIAELDCRDGDLDIEDDDPCNGYPDRNGRCMVHADQFYGVRLEDDEDGHDQEQDIDAGVVPTFGTDQDSRRLGELGAGDTFHAVPILSAHKKRQTLTVGL